MGGKELLKRCIGRLPIPYHVCRKRSVDLGFAEPDPFDMAIRLLYRHRVGPLFILQIGANDGLMCDPVRRYILECDCAGLLVEPLPWVFRRLVENYAGHADRLLFENVAIGNAEGTLELCYIAGDLQKGSFETGMATTDRKALQKKARGRRVEVVEVYAVTLETLIAKHNIAHVDVLQVDVEGYDFEVLKQFPFERMYPTVVRYEHNHLSWRDQQASWAFLSAKGYSISQQGSDTIGVHESIQQEHG